MCNLISSYILLLLSVIISYNYCYWTLKMFGAEQKIMRIRFDSKSIILHT